MNWRKPILSALLTASGSTVLRRLAAARRHLDATPANSARFQESRLSALLLHASRHVPFYARLLAESGVVRGEVVDPGQFHRLPLLTKPVLRAHFDELRSTDSKSRGPYENFSGGSTGEPIRLLQDREFREASVANTLLFFEMAGKEMGEAELKLWGSERDIFEGSAGLRENLHNILYHRLLLNSFRMGDREMRAYAEAWRRFRPKVVWTYVDSILEFARFLSRENLAVPAPTAIVTTAGTLHRPVRELVESVIGTRVLNQYGSREAGILGIEPLAGGPMRLFTWSQWVEVLDDDGRPCPPGQPGRVVVTNLDNHTMPLIRYEIGDTATAAADPAFPDRVARLQSVDGRLTDHFRSADGRLVHGEFFTHLFYGLDWVGRFQVVQSALDEVIVRYIPLARPPAGSMEKMTAQIRTVLGPATRVRFLAVDDIPPSPSGKFRFTICELDPTPATEMIR